MREILRKIHNNTRKGFTLAELLIVVAIMGILGGFGFVQLSNYMRSMKRQEMDNTAREIFVAAQNHLTVSKTSGNWKLGYYNPNGVDHPANIKVLDYQDAVNYQFDDVEKTTLDSTVHDAKHDFYFVIYNPSTYKDALVSFSSTLSQMLPMNSIDAQVRGSGSYVIEFDAVTATVYGVFYTDQGEFTDADLSDLNGYRSDEIFREEYGPDKIAIGYYGGAIANINFASEGEQSLLEVFNDGVKVESTGDTTETSIPQEDINAKALQVFLTDPNYKTSDITKVEFNLIEVQDANRTATFTINLNEASNPYKNGTGTESRIKNVITNKVTSNGIQYCITLDDILTDNSRFSDLFNEITPGTNIAIEAKIYSKNNELINTSNSVIFNSLFDDVTKVDANFAPTDSSIIDTYEASVRTGRHLQNLSSDLSKYEGEASLGTLKLTSAVLQDKDGNPINLKWNGTNSFTNSTDDDSRFVSIESNSLRNFDGNESILSDFRLVSNNSMCGLFSFATNMSVRDLTLIDFTGDSSDATGALIGSFATTELGTASISNVHVYDSDTDLYGYDSNYLQIKSKDVCGGLIGTMSGKGDISISYSSASVKTGKDDSNIAGGFIGQIKDVSKIIIDNCYVGGKVKEEDQGYDISEVENGNISGKNQVGGFIGAINNSEVVLTNSYTTASAVSENYAGGLVGSFENKSTLNMKNVYATGTVATTDSDEKKIGSFIGKADSDCVFVLQDGGYVAVLDMVSNINGAEIIGTGSVVDQDKVQVLTSIELSKQKNQAIQVIAYPYKESLGNRYPYPSTVDENGNVLPHYGDWTYISSGSGLFYYEKYDNDEYQIHGFNDEVTNVTTNNTVEHNYSEFGNSSFPTTSTTVVKEEGYIVTIANKNFDTKYYDSRNELDPVDAISIMRNDVLNEGNRLTERTLSKLIASESITEISDEEKQKLGLTDCHAYKLNIDKAIWKDIWSGDNQQLDVVVPIGGSTESDSNIVSIGRYYISPYFADSVKTEKTTVERIIRTASQLNRIAKADSNNSFANWGENKTVTQELNIDFKDVEKTIPLLSTIDYVGGVLTDTKKNVTLTLDKPFVSFLHSGSISDLNVVFDVNALTAQQISDATKDNKFGFFISDVQGTLENINFSGHIGVIDGSPILIDKTTVGILGSVNTTQTNLTFDGCSMNNLSIKANDFGFVGSVNGNLTGINIKDCSWSKVDVQSDPNNTTAVGMIGNLYSNGTIDNLHVDGATYDDVTATTHYFGIVGYAASGVTDSTFKKITWVNTTINKNASTLNTNVAIIAGSNGTISGIDVEDCEFNNVTAKAKYFGTVGFAGGSVTDSTFKKITWVNTKINEGASSPDTNVAIIAGSQGTISGIEVDDCEFNNVTAITKYFGTVGYAQGGVTDSSFKNITWNKTKINEGESNLNTNVAIIAGSQGAISGIDVENCVFNEVTAKTNNFSILPNTGSTISKISMDQVKWTDVTVTSSPSPNESYVTLIPVAKGNENVSNVTISNVTWDKLTTNANYVGMIGRKQYGSLEMSISNCNIVSSTITSGFVGMIASNESDSSNITIMDSSIVGSTITANAVGAIANNTSNITGLKIVPAGIETVEYGFEMYNLQLNAPYWGLIGNNTGKLSDLDFQNILIGDLDSSSTADSNEYCYGLIGKTTGSVDTLNIQNVLIKNVDLPNVTPDKVNIGFVGSVGTIWQDLIFGNGENDTTHVLDNLEMSDIKMNDTEFIDYGFIGKTENKVIVSNLNLTHYVSGGYGFINNNTGKIDHVTISKGTDDTSKRDTKIEQSQFVNTNSGSIDSCTVNVDASGSGTLNFYTVNTGSITNCKLNDAVVS